MRFAPCRRFVRPLAGWPARSVGLVVVRPLVRSGGIELTYFFHFPLAKLCSHPLITTLNIGTGAECNTLIKSDLTWSTWPPYRVGIGRRLMQ